MKQFFLIITFLFSLFAVSFSQVNYEIRQAMDFYSTNEFRTGEWKTKISEEDIDGSPYLNKEFIRGTIYTTSKQKFIDIPLRYNIYSNELEFKTPDDQVQTMATPEILELAEFGIYTMVYAPFSINNKVRHGYFQVVVSGKAALYSRSSILFKKAEKPGAYKDAVPAQFYNKPDTYFIQVGTADAKKVNNKKDLIKIFPDHQNQISSYLKKNKVKTNNLEMLSAVVKYYNTL